MLSDLFRANPAKVPLELQKLDGEAFLNTPEVRAIGERLAAEALAKRRQLVAELETVSEAREEAASTKALRAARQAVEEEHAAQQALVAARQRAIEARAAADAAVAPFRARRAAIHAELARGADPRIAQFHNHMLTLRDAHLNEPGRIRSWWSGRGSWASFETNIEEIGAAARELTAAMHACDALELEALSKDEVGKRLKALCGKLYLPLRSIGLQPPRIEDNQVVPEVAPLKHEVVAAERAADRAENAA